MSESEKLRHDVFLSYSTKNKDIADALVSDLEQHDITCWYAPRNIRPGEEWVTAITTALEHSKVLVLLYTEQSNASRQVMNEIAVAFNAGITIVPFRLSEVPMNSEFEYYLTRVHWFDAVAKPPEESIPKLREYLELTLREPEKAALSLPEQAKRSKRLPVILAAVALILVLSGLVWGGITLAKKQAEEREAAFRAARSAYWTLSDVGKEGEIPNDLTDLTKKIPDAYYYLGSIAERNGDPAAALADYEAGIQKESTLSLLGMGRLYLDGNGVPKDVSRAKEYFDQALSGGSAEAHYYEAYLYANGLVPGEERDLDKALDHLKEAAASEDKEILALSALLIGDLCTEGYPGEDREPEDAPAYYERASLLCPYYKGESCYRTGIYYASDEPETALEWYRKAADLGHRKAMIAAGRMYYEGNGVEVDEAIGKKYYLQAAGLTEIEEAPYFRRDPKGISEESLFNTLGLSYFYDYDYPRAEYLFLLEAELYQSANAMGNAAITFENDMDWENALKWYGAAIDAGHPDSDRYRKKIRAMVEDGVVSEKNAEKWL